MLANPETQDILAVRTHARTAWGAPLPLRLWHLASLDAPTVAAVWALAFAWAAGVRLPAWVLILLALVTWAVYVGDRLLDARRGFQSGAVHRLRDRHFFHWRHRRILAPLAVAAASCAAGVVMMRMPQTARERGSMLAAAALVYFTGVHSGRGDTATPRILGRLLNKELLVGVLFAAGCALPAWNRATELASLLLSVPFFAALAWLNCHAIESWEANSPQICHSGSPQICHSERAQRVEGPAFRPGGAIWRAALLLGAAGFLLALVLSAAHPRQAALIAAGAASALLLSLLDRLRVRLTPLALRAAADLVLLTPLALIWQ